MEWIERLNQAVGYLESNLSGVIDTDKAAQIAACSSFHLQRMFPYLAGVTLGEYIRRRKMTLAAFELANSDIKVINLALKYGYDSPTAFNRAFQSVHGVSPSTARKKGVTLSAFPRITFTLSIRGDKAMNYRIEKKEAFRVVGVGTREPMTMDDCFEKVPKFWESVISKGYLPKLCDLMDGSEPCGILGVSTCDDGTYSAFYVSVATNKPVLPGMEEVTIPAGEWAVFECTGAMPEAMQKLQQRILSEWLPASGYEYAPAPDIEVYFEGDRSSPGYHSQVWLPIVKK